MQWPAGVALAWFVLTALACASCWSAPVRARLARLRRPLVVAALVAAGMRLVPAVMALPGDALVQWDLDSYRIVAHAIGLRQDVYDLPGRYPYLPLHLYWLFAADRLAEVAHLPFLLVVKLPAIAADAGLAVAVGRTAAALGRRTDAAALALALALNPVSVLTTGYHGQFDAIPLLLTLTAWGVIVFRTGRWTLPVAALLFGLGVADKSWPALLAPVLLWRLPDRRTRVAFALLAALPALLAVLVYDRLVPGGAIHALRVVSGYQGVIGAWGFSEVMVRAAGAAGRENAIREAGAVGVWVLAATVTLAYVAASRMRRDPERMGLIIAAVYVAAAGWGVHWLAWLVPIAIAGGRRWGVLYLAGASAYAGAIYLGFGGILWYVVYVTGSLEPTGWSSLIGLVMWVGLSVGFVAGCLVALAPWVPRRAAVLGRRLLAAPAPFRRLPARRGDLEADVRDGGGYSLPRSLDSSRQARRG